MQVKDMAASVVLGLLFFSLLAIYFVSDRNPLVTGLSILIIAICLFIVRVGDWREIGIIGVVAAVISIVAAYLVGDQQFGNVGRILTPTLWTLLLVSIFSYIMAKVVRVPGDRALLNVRIFSGELVNLPAPLATPLPLIERPLATIPLYPLATDVKIENINTRHKFSVSELHVHVDYRVEDRDAAPRAMRGIPNRDQVQSRIAKELNKTVEQAFNDVRFWENLLSDQMRAEVDDVARMVIRDTERPYAAFLDYENIAGRIKEGLKERVNRWGVIVERVILDRWVLPDSAWPPRRSETEEEAYKQSVNAQRIKSLQEAQSQAEADRVRRLIAAVREAGIEDISDALLEDIIISATTDPGDRVLDVELNRWYEENFKPDKKKS